MSPILSLNWSSCLRVAGLLLGLTALSACSSLLRHPAPIASADQAAFDGYGSDIRVFPFSDAKPALDMVYEAFVDETDAAYQIGPDGARTYNYLAVSGGGSVGAFGAGILNGWTERGDRPTFKVVTGISTGSLIAPFAFLGADYDAPLKEAYTTVDANRIFVARRLLALLWSESVTDTGPFKELLAKYIDEKMLDAIAAEHAKGRRLYVGTTNLDREEPVIWDMGAIASSKARDRVAMFRQVLLASASIPTIFPPVLMDVTIDGKKYDEMHVDGGVFFQAFFIGAVIDLPKVLAEKNIAGTVVQNLYVIRNGFITPHPKQVTRSLTAISARAISTLLKMSGVNDLYRLYLSTRDDNVNLHYVAMPKDYVPTTDEEFNQAEMNLQYNLGFEMAKKGVPWQSVPPGYAAPDAAAAATP